MNGYVDSNPDGIDFRTKVFAELDRSLEEVQRISNLFEEKFGIFCPNVFIRIIEKDGTPFFAHGMVGHALAVHWGNEIKESQGFNDEFRVFVEISTTGIELTDDAVNFIWREARKHLREEVRSLNSL